MAEVFLARRRGAAGIAKRLVVKRMRPELTSDPRIAELFLREARVATNLSHKNVVTVFDVGRDQDGLFLAMEYVEGPDLAAAVQGARERGLRFDPLIAAHIASEVAAGLDYAHRARDESGAALGLVHRDISPRNILLSLDGGVKVTDFGVAVLGGDATDVRRGTVPYMSPEQARGEQVDQRADLFSLGLVLYELLADRRAYDGRERDAVLAQARAGQVPPLPAEVPGELADAVARATASRDQRFASARDMQRELAGWVIGERARRGDSDPPEHTLASFLAQAVPGWADQVGADAVGQAIGAAGTATLRSEAETMGDDRDRDRDEPPAVESTAPTRRSRLPLALVAAGALVLLTSAALLAARGGGPEEGAGAIATPDESRAAAPALASRAPARGAEPPPPARAAQRPTPGPVRELAPRARAKPELETSTDDRSGPGQRRVGATRGRAAKSGTLELNVVPWAYVSIDGGAEEETPIRSRVLPVGRHTIVIRNPVLEKRREIAVNILPGETTRYVVDLHR
jgi:tRNA A-37 threonylcarbamoyl transferase component Bud32